MGSYPVGAECCNNCVHWQPDRERRLEGVPPTRVVTWTNQAHCPFAKRSTLHEDSCSMFSHIGGVTKTHALPPKGPSPSEMYCESLLNDLVRKRDALIEERERNAEIERRHEAARREAERRESASRASERVKASEAKKEVEQVKANARTRELIQEGMSEDSMYNDVAVEFMHLFDRAKGGEAKAQYLLAKAFWNGNCGAKKEDESADCGKGWLWCNQAADNGYCWAQLHKGISWWNDAVESGNIEEYEKAVKWLEKALQHSEVRDLNRERDGSYLRTLNSARIKIGLKCLRGEDAELNYAKALECFDAVTESGDSRGAEFREKAEKLVADLKNQVKLLNESADDGYGTAMNVLGMMYAGYSKYAQYGLILECDDKKAFEWFSKAADAFCPDAMDNLGNCYKEGKGVEKDETKAVEWYKKSAEFGWPSGQYHYGVCLRKGAGIDKDEHVALHWFMNAGVHGHGRALNMLAWCAEGGRGMQEDPELAFEWYRRAADTGDAESMYELGRLYREGYGCEQDESRGDEWQKKAKANGYSG